ncbi:hypothetical protein L9F63_009224, partial [Diploptera punctata]
TSHVKLKPLYKSSPIENLYKTYRKGSLHICILQFTYLHLSIEKPIGKFYSLKSLEAYKSSRNCTELPCQPVLSLMRGQTTLSRLHNNSCLTLPKTDFGVLLHKNSPDDIRHCYLQREADSYRADSVLRLVNTTHISIGVTFPFPYLTWYSCSAHSSYGVVNFYLNNDLIKIFLNFFCIFSFLAGLGVEHRVLQCTHCAYGLNIQSLLNRRNVYKQLRMQLKYLLLNMRLIYIFFLSKTNYTAMNKSLETSPTMDSRSFYDTGENDNSQLRCSVFTKTGRTWTTGLVNNILSKNHLQINNNSESSKWNTQKFLQDVNGEILHRGREVETTTANYTKCREIARRVHSFHGKQCREKRWHCQTQHCVVK